MLLRQRMWDVSPSRTIPAHHALMGPPRGSLEKRAPCSTSIAQRLHVFLVNTRRDTLFSLGQPCAGCRSKGQHTIASMRPAAEMQFSSGRSKPSAEHTAAAVDVLSVFHVVFLCKHVSRLCCAHVLATLGRNDNITHAVCAFLVVCN